MNMPPKIESFYPGRGRNVVALISGIAGTAFFLRKLFHWEVASRRVEWILGWALISILALASLTFLRYLMWRKPTVTIGADGMFVSLPRLSSGLIVWSEIAKVAVVQFRYTDFVQIQLKGADIGAHRSVISIPAAAIDVTAKELARKIQERLEYGKNGSTSP